MTTLDDWRALLADVEAATGPDGEIDRTLAGFCSVPADPFTSSVDAVSSLIEREMPEFLVTKLEQRDDGEWHAELLHRRNRRLGGYCWGNKSLALAMLAAFIRATIAQLEQSEATA